MPTEKNTESDSPVRPRHASSVRYLPADVVAANLGICTATLAKWRVLGKGPKGWFHLCATRVVYPDIEVEKFIREKMASRPDCKISRFRRPSGGLEVRK